MKYLKVIIPVSILSLVFIIDYYNKFYKPNTSFEDESIFLYVMEGDSLAFRDSISKYIKYSEKTRDRKNLYISMAILFFGLTFII